MPPTWQPTAAELSAFLDARTIGGPGDPDSPSGVFSRRTGALGTDTTITSTQANALIPIVMPEVVELVGDDDPTLDEPAVISAAVKGLAKLAVLYRAAADLEGSSFPRQTGRDQTANTYWDKRADKLIARIETALEREAAGDAPGSADNVGSGSVVGYFRDSKLVDCYGRPRIV